MSVTDWKSPGTCAAVNRTGGAGVWQNPDNVKVSDNVDASVWPDKDGYSHWLRCTNFGFSTDDVPEGMSVVGIEVAIERAMDGPGPFIDSALYLRKTAGGVGDNKASAVEWPYLIDETATYGGASDAWSSGLSDSDIRDSDFGIDFSVTPLDSTSGGFVDHIQIRVHYEEAAVGQPMRHRIGRTTIMATPMRGPF